MLSLLTPSLKERSSLHLFALVLHYRMIFLSSWDINAALSEKLGLPLFFLLTYSLTDFEFCYSWLSGSKGVVEFFSVRILAMIATTQDPYLLNSTSLLFPLQFPRTGPLTPSHCSARPHSPVAREVLTLQLNGGISWWWVNLLVSEFSL